MSGWPSNNFQRYYSALVVVLGSAYTLTYRKSRFAVLFGAAALLVSCSGGGDEEPEAVRPAKLFVVQDSKNRLDVSFPAIIEASQSSMMAFQVSGRVDSFPVREGQRVRRGAVIARLGQRRYRNAVNAAQADYANAQSEYQSAEALLREDAIAKITVDQRRAKRDVARAKLNSARQDLSDTILRAPYSGMVAIKHVAQYANVQPGADIVTLQSTGTVEASVSIPASMMQNLARKPSSETYVVLSAAPDLKIPGHFRSITTQADTQSQTFQVKFAFNPPPGITVLPGMTGTVIGSRDLVSDDGGAGRITIPIGAVMSDGKTRYVWIVDTKTMAVKKGNVQVEKGDVGDELAISSGLKPGETIVSAGGAYLHDGMKIRRYKP